MIQSPPLYSDIIFVTVNNYQQLMNKNFVYIWTGKHKNVEDVNNSPQTIKLNDSLISTLTEQVGSTKIENVSMQIHVSKEFTLKASKTISDLRSK